MDHGTVPSWPHYSSLSLPFLEVPRWSFSFLVLYLRQFPQVYLCPLHLCVEPAGCYLPRDDEPGLLCPSQPVLFLLSIFLIKPKFPENRNFHCVFFRVLPTMPESQWSVSITDLVNVDKVSHNLENKSLTWQSNRKSNYSYSEDHDHSTTAVKLSRRLREDGSETFSLENFTCKIWI